jgi:peptide/nickel transport system substrate-binding protein
MGARREKESTYMVNTRKPLAVAAAAALAVGLAGCGGGSTNPNSGSSSAAGKKGGTLYYLTNRPTEHLDPQRTYIGRDISNMSRLAYRSLVTYPITTDTKKATTPVPDLATDTGQSSNGGKVWKFTLKDGVKWQDGKPITCADLKYGVSRSFATDVITGGPNYILGNLDVPHSKDGLPLYNGPYKNAHKADFDKAVLCSSDNKTITYKFNKPFPDFPLAAASLLSFDPYRKDQDQGDKSNYAVFASGPYKLQGKWNTSKGGTFVRNTNWSTSTDDVRKALPDKIVFTQGLTPEVVNDRLISDTGQDQMAVTDQRIPPADYSQITGPVKDRSTLTDSPFVDYILPNFNRIKNLKVRQALLASLNAQGWIDAGGGDKAYKPAKSLVNPALIGYQPNPNFKYPPSGDVAAAKKLLAQSGEKLPYPIKFTYSGGTPTLDKEAAALANGWKQAGFKVTLDPLTETYYDVIQKPTADSDVMWGGWGADWPSIATVLPPLFDSRINLTSASNGQDYGNYRSDKVNKLIDEASSKGSVEEQAKVYSQIDDQLGKDVAYMPLEITRFYYLHGSKVTGYVNNPATSGYPDLGAAGVTS